MITKEQLDTALLAFNPEVQFAAENGNFIIMSVDAFNGHINWKVRQHKGKEILIKDFLEDFCAARDYFLSI